ncbi:hypothetical protein FG386_003528 [Cryptosporidium ryanae]|uniref:uncharacterized protein n=1 Tax=Cryptosporidium ryanae TaxID=515981 RepID=UPI003519F6C1|nr:hypothetical protein FG386_003528 [Cryptosporidium ryanae]
MNCRNQVFNRENHKLFLNGVINGEVTRYSPSNTQVNSIYIHGIYWILCSFELLKYKVNDELTNIRIIRDILSRCKYIYTSESTVLTGYSLNPFESLSPTILSTLSGIKINILIRNKISDNERNELMNFILRNLKFINSNEAFFSNSSFQNNDVDIRFIYSALSSIYLLNMENIGAVKNNIPIPQFLNTLKNLQNIDGGFGRRPRDESHAGHTFCAVASIALIQKFEENVDVSIINHDRLKRWLLKRIIIPEDHEMIESESLCFNGRMGKRCDVCYSWWVIASLKMVESIFKESNDIFSNEDDDTLFKLIFGIIYHQNKDGGFQKIPFRTVDVDNIPDPLHTFLSISALSILIRYLIDKGGSKVFMFLESAGFLDSISDIDPITMNNKSGFIWKVIDINEFKWFDNDLKTLYYDCPCGDIFWVKFSDLESAIKDNESEKSMILECESCSLKIKVKFCRESIKNLYKPLI